MRSYEQAMESLRLGDPEFHQKLTAILKNITELPQESFQQLSKSLDGIANTNIRREKITSTPNSAVMESSKAFEEEASFNQQVTTSLWNAGHVATETFHELKRVLSSYAHGFTSYLEHHGELLSDAADVGFLIVCFTFTTYIFYNKDVSGRSASSSLVFKTSACFIVAVSIWLMTAGLGDLTSQRLFQTLTLGALAGKLPALLPPSKLWPDRPQRPDGPKTWLATLGHIFGFLLCSGFLASVALILEKDLRERFF